MNNILDVGLMFWIDTDKLEEYFDIIVSLIGFGQGYSMSKEKGLHAYTAKLLYSLFVVRKNKSERGRKKLC